MNATPVVSCPNFGKTMALSSKLKVASEFDQYGDKEASGVDSEWQRQLLKFASVQDRLREWNPDVMKKIQKFSCMVIKALDIDAVRIDKATQVTLDALVSWASNTRACAADVGKNNFFSFLVRLLIAIVLVLSTCKLTRSY